MSSEKQAPTPLAPHASGEGVRSWRWSKKQLLTVALASFVAAVHAWVHAALWDMRQLERDPFDQGWLLQYVWRAGRGEWVGIDFTHVRGPLYQLFLWVASGGAAHSPGWEVEGTAGVSAVLAMVLGAVLLQRTLKNDLHVWVATLAWAFIVLWAPSDALRTLASVALVVSFAAVLDPSIQREAGLRPTRREWIRGGGAGALLVLLTAFSFDRASLGALALVAMAGWAVALALYWRASLAPILRAILAAFVGGVGTVAILSLAFAALGGSYLGYLMDMSELSRSFSIAMHAPTASGDSTPSGVTALLLCCGALAGWLGARRMRLGGASIVLIGALAFTPIAFLRSDTQHTFPATAAVMIALVIAALHVAPRFGAFASLPFWVLAIVVLAGWLGSDPATQRSFRALPGQVVAILGGGERGVSYHRGDVGYALGELRAFHRAHPDDCVATSESLTGVTALADVPSLLHVRWTGPERHALTREIRERACPRYLHRLQSLDGDARYAGYVFGEDFVRIASDYAPARMLGPGIVAMDRRPRPIEVTAEPIEYESEEDDGTITLRWSRPIPVTHFVRLHYTIETRAGVRETGGAPYLKVEFVGDPTFVEQQLTVLDVDRSVGHDLAADVFEAEWRWMAGVRPRFARVSTGARIHLAPAGRSGLRGARVRIDRVEVLAPPDEREARWPAPLPAGSDIVNDLRVPLIGRYATPIRGPGVLAHDPPSSVGAEAQLFFPVHTELGLRLVGEAFVDSEEGDGVLVSVRLLDVHRYDLRRDPAATFVVEPDPNARHAFDVPLDAFVDRDVLVEVVASAREDTHFDHLRFSRLALVREAGTFSFAGALHAGDASVVGAAEHRIGTTADLFVCTVPPALGETSFVLPIRPSQDTCLDLDLEQPSVEGDGVWFEASVRDGPTEYVLLRRPVLAGESAAIPPLSLWPWTDTDITLELSVFAGGSSDYDELRIVRPTIARGCRTRDLGPALDVPERARSLLAEATMSRATIRGGAPQLTEQGLVLHPVDASALPPTAIDLPIEADDAGSCVRLLVRHEDEEARGDGLVVRVSSVDADGTTEIGRHGVAPGGGAILWTDPIPSGARAIRLQSFGLRTCDFDWAHVRQALVLPCPLEPREAREVDAPIGSP
ncbi:MAG: hypothetical protein AB7S26_00120 [Sandaracinaceae bacterium]